MTNVEFTSEVVRSATFREKLKGYNPEDVHAFMERSAAAIDQLTARLAEASARALKAEAALASNSEADESVRRTLVLAQRTAEMAVREANEEAATIRFEAHHEADQVVADARAAAERNEADASRRAAELTAAAEAARADADAYARATVNGADAHAAAITAEAEARVSHLDEVLEAEIAAHRAEAFAALDRESEAAREEIERSVAELARQRGQLWADVDALGAYLATERARVIDALQGAVDRFGETLEPDPLPDVERPEPQLSADLEPVAHEDDAPEFDPHEGNGSSPRHATEGEPPRGWAPNPSAWGADELPAADEVPAAATWSDETEAQTWAEPARADEQDPWADAAPAAWAHNSDAWGRPTAEPDAAWDENAYAHDPGWSEAHTAESHPSWPPATPDEPDSAWGQPVETSYHAGWAADDDAQPAWEWPGRAGGAPDLGPAATWFTPESGAPSGEQAPAWPAEQWDRVSSVHEAADETAPWGRGNDDGSAAATWPSGSPTTWSSWGEEAADPATARDPWAGIEPVDDPWRDAPDRTPPADVEDEPPSRLMFTLGDEARGGARPGDEEPLPKPRKNLLGRLKG